MSNNNHVHIGNKIYKVELVNDKIKTTLVASTEPSEKQKMGGRLFNVDDKLIKTVYDNEKDEIYYTEIEKPNKIVSTVTIIIYLVCIYFVYLIITI